MPFLGKILWKNPSPAGRYSCEICHWWVNFISRSMTFHPWSKSRVNSRVSTFMDWPWLSVMRAWHPPSRYLGGRSATFSNHKFLCYLTSFELPQLLTGMEKLQHLDISDERDAQHPLDVIATIPNRLDKILKILRKPTCDTTKQPKSPARICPTNPATSRSVRS